MLDTRKTALVVIDLMPRIVALDAAPYSGPEVVRQSLRLVGAFHGAGSLVVQVRVERPGVAEQPPGSSFVAEMEPQDGDLEIVKRAINAFHETGLQEELRDRGIATLVLAGIATNWGVEGTGRAASDYDYELLFAEDAMTSFTEEQHTFAVTQIFPRLGTVTTVEKILGSLA
ncbi:Nicotinamidase-related amidase [Microbispora rosea]|uniref:Nicotinamidase-related amidase n=1 Tax=Microbispora rosea TaxID=58117 RepID=A0A1N6TSP5_9ACTN|nr:isochorismatase family protein [Microbispora rosea]GIH44957.1 hydrolase [Microbispora rosea subsp. rosea]SIQ56353.1 Nicotinamidase-related amidase [Microbispora rosea]